MDKENTENKKTKKINTMDIILFVVGVLLVLFTAKMVEVYEQCGAIPETLCTCVFAILGGECGVMGWIKTTKEKNTGTGTTETTETTDADKASG